MMASQFLFSPNSNEEDLEHFSFCKIHLHKNDFSKVNLKVNLSTKMQFSKTRYKVFLARRLTWKFHNGEQGEPWKINRLNRSHYSWKNSMSEGFFQIWPLLCNSDDDIWWHILILSHQTYKCCNTYWVAISVNPCILVQSSRLALDTWKYYANSQQIDQHLQKV